MLPFFTSSGHNNYAKSAWLNLQLMRDLKNTNPPVYEAFAKGLHVIRRSDRSWSGLSADLVIEQELMKSLKTAGELTRGSGMTEENRALWILSGPLCSQVSSNMKLVTKTLYKSSEQHKEQGKARQQRYSSDAEALFEVLDTSSPFRGDPKLRNITNGMVTCESVNVNEAQVIDQKILDDMKGCSIASYTFKKKAQAVQMKTMQTLAGGLSRVDPFLLFQRFLTLARRSKVSEMEFFE